MAAQIFGEKLGAQDAVTLASMSKEEIVAFCDKIFSERFAMLTEAQQRAIAA
jgi:ParB family chromosome partitioning protein